jgi:hypothetical protein
VGISDLQESRNREETEKASNWSCGVIDVYQLIMKLRNWQPVGLHCLNDVVLRLLLMACLESTDAPSEASSVDAGLCLQVRHA